MSAAGNEVSVSYTPQRTPRVKQLEALFDAPDEKLSRTWKLALPLDEQDWSIGLIVGPSGSGKTTVARHLFGSLLDAPEWGDRPLVDEFPSAPIQDITGLLSSVGLGSVPAWIRPYHTLSTGEQFRAHVARMLAECPDMAVVDEWTSTVDRQVAKVTSAATAKAVRRRGQRLVAVTCHYDVLDWLQPDWVYEPHAERFTWRSVQPRPAVNVEICAVDHSAWEVFKHHHYLSAQMNTAAKCYGAFVDGECVAFAAVTVVPHPSPKARDIRRVSRLVVLPDWQGIGVATRFIEVLGEDYAKRGHRFRLLTAHPGLVRYHLRSPEWECFGKPGYISRTHGPRGGIRGLGAHQAAARMMMLWGFQYVPERRRKAGDQKWKALAPAPKKKG